MVGLARKITKDYKSKKKEDLIDNEIKSMFKNTGFYDVDLNEPMPLLDEKKLRKILLIDGSDRYSARYAPAVMAMLDIISPISYVKNLPNTKIISFGGHKPIKKRPYWPTLNVQHTYDQGEHVISLKIYRTKDFSALITEQSVIDQLIEKGRCFIIGDGASFHNAFVISAYVDEDWNVKKIILKYGFLGVTRSTPIEIEIGTKLTVEKVMSWYSTWY